LALPLGSEAASSHFLVIVVALFADAVQPISTGRSRMEALGFPHPLALPAFLLLTQVSFLSALAALLVRTACHAGQFFSRPLAFLDAK
jgi:hypothetical protein